MIRHTEAVTVRRPVPEVFDFVATHNYENHPRWEAEVLEIRPLTVGPVRVGASTWAPSPRGAMRLLTPVFRLRMPCIGARLTGRLRQVIEAGAPAV